ncbi:MAG: nitrite and sulphite reductase 4Fe-4S region [Phycisphaerales bacterium]|nr:nitrite and sulphite reductase 4Fe-4S region [Phycisphaerales bacterium]
MNKTWKDVLQGQLPEDWAREIDNFEAQMLLRKQGKIEEKVFAETRLRRGTYGQRYDNGKRHDGIASQTLVYPTPSTKGPETLWDAPGMTRIKIPFGGMNPEQMRVMADLAEEYSDSICHVTTRQDIQLHYTHIEDAPSLFRRLAAVGITTKEACGNSVRNVTACPLAGVCHTESFDVTPYAKAIAFYLLGHPDTQDFGRKFKIAFSGCKHEACALVSMHDLGGIGVTKVVDGVTKRGFELYIGGGLGAVPHQAKLVEEFLPEEELLPYSRAVGRVFARLGEKKNRNKARVKFLIQKLGIEEFKKLVHAELASMPEDPSWRRYFDEIPKFEEKPAFAGVQLNGAKRPDGYDGWAATNVYRQRQSGFATVTVHLPLGDLSSDQMRKLADVTHRYASDHARLTVEQNVVLRWVPENKVPALYEELKRIGLGLGGAGTIVDVTSCPGTDTCKLGIASSRGLAGELRTRLAEKAANLDAAVQGLRIKVSGCFNSCGQHHVADLGFYGNSRNVGGYTVPHFQVMIGGKWRENGGSYALAIGSVPSRRIPDVVDRLTDRYVRERQGPESFQAFCARVGKKDLKAMLDDLTKVPPHQVAPEYYSDWGDPREFTIGDLGVGECAGEVVSLSDFGFTDAESKAFEAQLLLDDGHYKKAEALAYDAMLTAAKTLVQLQFLDVPNTPDAIVGEFRARFVEPKLFWHAQHHGQFANYLFARHADGPDVRYTRDTAAKLVEEANLFIDAAHQAHAKWRASLSVANVAAVPPTIAKDGLKPAAGTPDVLSPAGASADA